MKDAIILKSMKCADIDEAAIFVSSPFQALCALEAINEFKVKRPVFYLQGHEISYEMTRKYLIKNGFTYIDVAETSNAFEAIKIHHRHKKFQYLFVGDYFSCGHFLLSMLWSKINATIVYLDDGNSTLSLLPPTSRKRLNSGSSPHKIFYLLLELYKNLKGIRRVFFSFYNLTDRGFPYPIITNNLSILKTDDIVYRKYGIYIIGTNSSQIGWSREMYVDKIRIIRDYVRKNTNEPIYYCPHRRDERQYQKEFQEIGIFLYETEVSVEVDFVSNKLYPSMVFGFGSTAMLTLKMLYPEAIFYNFVFHSQNQQIESGYRKIEDEFTLFGIKVTEIENLI